MVIPRRETCTVWLHLALRSVRRCFGPWLLGPRRPSYGEGGQAEATALGRNPTSEGVWLMEYERHCLVEMT